MRILAWNSHELENPHGVRNLCDLLRRKEPDLVFFQETKREWLFTGVYGHPEVRKRKEFWDLLRSINGQDGSPRIVTRDFNEILYHSEKKRGRIRVEKQLEDFREALLDCCLRDLGFSGSPFTWSNGRGGKKLICERLDRSVANSTWCALFPQGTVTHGFVAYSDQVPLLLLNTNGREHKYQGGAKPYRFEEMWAGEKGFKKIIQESWGHKTGTMTTQVMGQIQVWRQIESLEWPCSNKALLGTI